MMCDWTNLLTVSSQPQSLTIEYIVMLIQATSRLEAATISTGGCYKVVMVAWLEDARM